MTEIVRNHQESKVLVERIAQPLQVFLEHHLSATALLLIATVTALLWANSPYAHYYHEWLHINAKVGIGAFELEQSLQHWVNDGLMSVFFFVVGLEIKREFLAGELANPRTAALPIFAAIGGMLVPALVYISINPGGDAFRGWGVPVATDIAFALGILALLPVSVSLKVFLTALAIVDDIGAILVVAVFYTENIALLGLLAGGLFLVISIGFNMAGVRNPLAYFLVGMVVWLAFLESGIHATLASVLMAFTIPAKTRIDGPQFAERAEHLLQRLRATGLPRGNTLLSSEQHDIVHSMEQVSEKATAPLQELEHALMPFVSFLILPVFALANAGVTLTGGIGASLGNSVAIGAAAGLVIGKPLGIFLFSWLALRLKIAELPAGVNLLQIAGAGMLAGIGFTMALFIATLAWPDQTLVDMAKSGVLLGSLISAVAGVALLHFGLRRSS